MTVETTYCRAHGGSTCYVNADGTHVPGHSCACTGQGASPFGLSVNCPVEAHAAEAQRVAASMGRPDAA